MTRFPPSNAEKVESFLIAVATLPDQSVEVGIEIPHKDDPPEFKTWMCACEYLMNIVAQNSSAGYEKALDLLREGAMKYKHYVIPYNPPKEKPSEPA